MPSASDDMCSMCGGQLAFLGQLGNTMHFRCINCGMDYSRPAVALGWVCPWCGASKFASYEAYMNHRVKHDPEMMERLNR